MKPHVEIISPVGSFAALQAAIQAKADLVYFGIDRLNMRSRSSANFSLEDVPEIVRICRKAGIKSCLTLNSVVYNDDLPEARLICDAVKKAGVFSVIACDLAIIGYAASIGLPVHISTQANVSNIEAVRFFAKFSDVIVLARELTLEQIASICRTIDEENLCGPSGNKVKIEIFVHGALCVSISGKCYMSLARHNASANRGECLQVCRRKYRVIDETTQEELVLDNQYVMSPKDLCTIEFLDQIVASGVSILKIEGRSRSPEYVATVTEVYKEALEHALQGAYSADKIQNWLARLDSVFHRGFWSGGYYLGKHLGEWSGSYGSQASLQKTYAGKIINYYSKISVAECLLEAENLSIGDEILIVGDKTGVARGTVSSLCSAEKDPISKGEKGSVVTFAFPKKLRKNDRVYVMSSRSADAKTLF